MLWYKKMKDKVISHSTRSRNDGWIQKIEFKKKVMGPNGADNEDSLVMIQNNIEEAANTVSHATESTRQKNQRQLQKM